MLCCCRVPLQPQFRQFCSVLLLIFVVFAKIRQFSSVVSAVLLLSSTPATVTFVYNLTFVRFVLSVLCCCRVSLQPQLHLRLRQFLQDLSSLPSSFASCSQRCVVVEFHSSHSCHLRSLRVVSAVLLLSSTPATVTPTPTPVHQNFFIAGFVVFTIFVRFVYSVLCCC